MPRKNLTILWITALALGWLFDQLFWKQAHGINFLIYVLLCLAAGFWLTWRETEGFKILRPPRTSLILLAPVLYFAVMAFLRQEPMSQFASFSLALAGMAVLSATWLGGRWWQYNLSDYVSNFFLWLGGALGAGSKKHLLSSEQNPQQGNQVTAEGEKAIEGSGEASGAGGASQPGAAQAKRRDVLRIARGVLVGLLLATPVIFILAGLLAAADPIFDYQMRHVLEFLSFDKLAEYIFRSIYILIGAYLLAGVFLYALRSSPGEKVTGGEKPWLTPFLGWIEAATLLACVDLLFAFFVAIQFRYFFGGQANITVQGYTYSEYARRGFGELAAVAFISLLLFLGLSFITRRETNRPRKAFSGLGITLVLLVGVMLVSAFQRLLLYEAAYGFSRLRTYTHVFMLWLGLLLLATVVLESLGRLRYFALAMVIAVLGFGFSLTLLNVDGLIVRQNVARSVDGAPLDGAYLTGLSDDAVPALFDLAQRASLPEALRTELGGALACRKAFAGDRTRKLSWPSFHWSNYRAEQLYARYASELQAYPVSKDGNGRWQVQVNGDWRACQVSYSMD
jgi:hypothetical protein